ncbi:MAG: recombinase family protein [Nitrospirae bacterium]|nr:recombinase family protein [Nitrospirota bacterium]
MKKKTVAVYARVSTDKQKVDMQLQELSDFIKRSGWKLYKTYIDHGYTGANTRIDQGHIPYFYNKYGGVPIFPVLRENLNNI